MLALALVLKLVPIEVVPQKGRHHAQGICKVARVDVLFRLAEVHEADGRRVGSLGVGGDGAGLERRARHVTEVRS